MCSCPRADNGRGHGRLMQQPCECDISRVLAPLSAELLPRLDGRTMLFECIGRAATGTATRRAVRHLANDAAEQSSMQGRPRDHADAVCLGGRKHLELDGALDEVVDRLLAHQPQLPSPRRGLLRLCEMPACEVGGADIDDLALIAEDLHRLPDLIPWSRAVDVVHLVKVDVVGLHALERRIAGPADVQCRELAVIRPVAHVAVELRREDGALPAAVALGEPLADDALGETLVAPPVDIRGVEEVDAMRMGAVHDRKGILLARHGPEVHRAETDSAHG